MSLYVLDTDILSLYQRGDAKVIAAVDARSGEVAVTVISVEEQLSGWYGLLRRAKRREQIAAVYERLALTVRRLAGLEILSYTEAAIVRYEQLNVRKMDLRIAAIALENGATVVTRNLRDFRRIPGLAVEDWTL